MPYELAHWSINFWHTFDPTTFCGSSQFLSADCSPQYGVQFSSEINPPTNKFLSFQRSGREKNTLDWLYLSPISLFESGWGFLFVLLRICFSVGGSRCSSDGTPRLTYQPRTKREHPKKVTWYPSAFDWGKKRQGIGCWVVRFRIIPWFYSCSIFSFFCFSQQNVLGTK